MCIFTIVYIYLRQRGCGFGSIACVSFLFVCKHNKAKHFAWLMIKLCRDVEWGPITINYNLAYIHQSLQGRKQSG